MNKIILIREIEAYPVKVNKWISVFSGVLMTVVGLYYIFIHSLVFEPMGLIMGILFFVSGLGGLYYSVTTISAHSRYALRVKINDDFIEFKNSLFRPRVRIDWSEIKYIALKQYRVIFDLGGYREVFSYSSTPEVSRKIKKAIREMAVAKGVEVYP